MKNLVLLKEGGDKIMEKIELEAIRSQINQENESVELAGVLYLTYNDFYNARQKHINGVTQLYPK